MFFFSNFSPIYTPFVYLDKDIICCGDKKKSYCIVICHCAVSAVLHKDMVVDWTLQKIYKLTLTLLVANFANTK